MKAVSIDVISLMFKLKLDKIYFYILEAKIPSSTELQKASSTSSAELSFFQIFSQICPVFRQIFIFERAN